MKKYIFLLSLAPSFQLESHAQAVGIGTTTPNSTTVLHADATGSTTRGFLFSGNYIPNSTVPDLGIGSRLMFYPGKAAFRAGTITLSGSTEYWNNINVGEASVGLGSNNIASHIGSVAIGSGTKALAGYAIAIGSNAVASGSWSVALGSGDASGNHAVALGGSSFASGGASTTMGWQTVAKGYASTVIGYYNDSILATNQGSIQPTTPLFIIGNGANGARSNAMVVLKNGSVGIGTNAPDASSLLHINAGTTSKCFLVSGTSDIASIVPNLGGGTRMMFFPGKSAFRAGKVFSDEWNNSNVGSASVAMGYGTIASGIYSVALGDRGQATGEASTALGWQTEATGFATTALGAKAVASGQISTAIGYVTTARGYASTVVGLFNDPILAAPQTDITSATPLFIVGNGASGSLSNAMVVLKNGNVGIGTNAPAGNLVLNDADPILQLQNNGIDKGFVQLNGNDLRMGVNGTNPTGNVVFRLNTGDRFTIFPTGNATLTGTLTQNSDERFKQDITPISDALDKVMQLNGYEYHWKPELQRDSALQIGLIAQNVEKVLPQLVATDKEGSKSVAYQNIIAVLIEAMKEQQAQIKNQQTEIDTMKKTILHSTIK